MATIQQIADAAATTLAGISGLRATGTWPSVITPDMAIVEARSGEYHQAMGSPGHAVLRFEVLILTAAGSMRGGQNKLDAYLDVSGSASIRATLEANATLGGLVASLLVERFRDRGLMEVAGGEYMGAKVEVTVWP